MSRTQSIYYITSVSNIWVKYMCIEPYYTVWFFINKKWIHQQFTSSDVSRLVSRQSLVRICSVNLSSFNIRDQITTALIKRQMEKRWNRVSIFLAILHFVNEIRQKYVYWFHVFLILVPHLKLFFPATEEDMFSGIDISSLSTATL